MFLREIMVSTQGKDNDLVALAVAEKKALDLVTRARKGGRFAEMAQVNSDSSTAQYGGVLDPATKGDYLDAEVEAAVWDKEKNYVTDPIRRPGGWLILKVDEHHKTGLADFEEVQPSIQDFLMKSRSEPALRAYLTKLRQDAFL
jgi:peptidyl-prolyl cis-trans isomerase SurA